MPDNCLLEKLLLDKFSELAEKASAHPVFLLFFNIGFIALGFCFGVDIANIFISIVTAEIVLISAGAARRSQLAIHAKLDEIVHSVGKAREDLVGIEHKTEQEIIEAKLGD
jgi:low affinity Fe/Cu permease